MCLNKYVMVLLSIINTWNSMPNIECIVAKPFLYNHQIEKKPKMMWNTKLKIYIQRLNKKTRQSLSWNIEVQTGMEGSSYGSCKFAMQVLDSKDRRPLTTSTMDGLFSGTTEVQRSAMSKAPIISWWQVCEILGSRTCCTPLVIFTFLLTHFTMSSESFDSVCSACLPLTSSSNTTPKL